MTHHAPADQWYCLRTHTRGERAAAARLREELQIEVFCPSIRFERVRRSGKVWVCEALFPGYLFARFEYVGRYRQVQSSQGVSQILSFGGVPAVIPDAVIETVRESVTDNETILMPSITPGTEVQVIGGVFQGLRAVVSRVMPSRERIAVLVELLGEIREVEIAQSAVLADVDHPLASGHRG